MVASIGKCNEIPQSQIQSNQCETVLERIDGCLMFGELPDVPGYADLPDVTSAGFGTGYRSVFIVPEILKRFSDTSEKLLTHTIRRKGAFFNISHRATHY